MACCSLMVNSSETRTTGSTRTRSISAGVMAKKTMMTTTSFFVLLSSCGPLFLPGQQQHGKQGGGGLTLAQAAQLDFEPRYGDGDGDGGGGGASSFNRHQRGQSPRILTLLTTYSNRTAYAKANREAMEERADGYESLVFITSDQDDKDMDEAVSFKYGEARNHRLLAAVTEAYSRHKGEFDWIAIGDDDTVFMYNRARAFLRNIDHREPVALGFVDGLITDQGKPAFQATCFSPSEKLDTSSHPFSDRGCCQDFTRPCQVPPFPDISEEESHGEIFRPSWWEEHQEITVEGKRRNWHAAYGKGGLYWPYGGAGTLLSAGLLEKVQGDDGTGWERCTEVFGVGFSTDIQLGMCLRAHGLTMSAYFEGFDRWCTTADPDSIRNRLAQNCQVLGIHLGLHHLSKRSGTYTPQSFKDAAAAVHDEDQRWASQTGLYMAAHCPQAWDAITTWKK